LGHKFGALPQRKNGGPQTSKFGAYFGQLPSLIADISGTIKDIVEQKMSLQAAISPTKCALYLLTLFGKK